MKININWSICRVCLKEEIIQERHIFDIDDDQIEIATKITECTGIKIERNNNNLPTLLCKKCMMHLNIAYKFRTICINSDMKLQNFLLKTNNVITEIIQNDDEDDNPPDEDANEDADEEENTFEEYIVNEEENEEENDEIVGDVIFEFNGNELTDDEDEQQLLELQQHHQIQSNIIMDEHYIKEEENYNNENHNCEMLEHLPIEDVLLEEGDEDCVLIEFSNKSDLNDDQHNIDNTLEKYVDYKCSSGKRNSIQKQRNVIKPIHVCEICGNKFTQKYLLENHMKWHRNEKPFSCEICSKNFALNFQLTRHMRSHTGQKPYSCKYCSRKFSDRSTNIKHERLHTGERPFQCETCLKTFTYADVLKKHLLTHTGEKPYSCEPCGKRFSQAHHLKAHLNTALHQGTVRRIDEA